MQGVVCLTDRSAVATESVCLALAACAVFILAGFMTPFASVALSLGVLAMAFSWVSPPAHSLFSNLLPAILVATISVAVGLLGPGMLSVDFRLFGRREIIIPRKPSPGRLN